MLKKVKIIIRENAVMTNETGIYIPKFGGVLISLVVDNVDCVYEKLKKLNLDELTELQKNEELNIKTVKFIGPERYRFEVEEFLDEKTRKIF